MNKDEVKRAVRDLAEEFGVDPVAFAERWVAKFPPPTTNGNGNGHANGNGKVPAPDLTDLQVQALPPVRILVPPGIPYGSLVAIAAPKGSAKTFYALDIAFTVAMACQTVLLVALEGLPTHRDRIIAWKEHHGIPADQSIPGLHWRPLGYRLDLLRTEQVDELVAHVRQVGPQLVVLDNLNHAVLDDENNPGVMARATDSLNRVRDAMGTDGTLVVLDNFGHSAKRLRGHSKKGDPFDTLIYMKRVGDDGTEVGEDDEDEALDRVKVWCGHQRNGPKFAKFFLQFTKVGPSGVLVPIKKPEDPVLAAMDSGVWYGTATLMEITGKSRSTVQRRLKFWVEREVLVVRGEGRGTEYQMPGFTMLDEPGDTS